MSFTSIGQTTPLLLDFQPKSLIEDFQMDYGRMNATIGIEMPHTNVTNQTSIIQGFIDPPTEVVQVTVPASTPIGTAGDGTQIWKITHNGVDTHSIHVHMFNIQLINRVGWDGAIKPPDANELGWKDTVRMNPLEDVIVALRPMPLTLPFLVPNSIRQLDVTRPLGSTVGFINVKPQALPVTVTNELTNFGWEYVWHCHLLGHEENDMMRNIAIAVPPETPSNLTAVAAAGNVDLTWIDNSASATGFTIQRATDNAFTQNLITFTTGPSTGPGSTVAYTDTTAGPTPAFYYQVQAFNAVGSLVSGYPTITTTSGWSNIAQVGSGPAIGVTPASLAFGNQIVATTSAPQTLTVSNSGGAPLTINSITITGANFTDFAQTNACGASLAGGANCTISVTFTPMTAGARTANLSIGTSDPLNPTLTVALSGSGQWIIVVFPKGGEVLNTGSAQTIQWTYTGNPGRYVAITLLKGGAPYATLARYVSTGSGGAGQRGWTVGNFPTGADYHIQVISMSNPALTGMSAGMFTIQGGAAVCTYSVTPLNPSFGATGGTASLNVTTTAGCAWIATSNDAWITMTSGSSGTGSGTVLYTVSPNTSANPRSGTMTVAGRIVTVSQAGTSGCVGPFSISGIVRNLRGLPEKSVRIVLSGTGYPTQDNSTQDNGAYSFNNVPNGTYTLTPSRSGIRFTPVNQTVTVNCGNVTGVNFTAQTYY
ncbi:MAG: choice-of-anchor D domain-containing protein [Candidatus Omnitrophica bacterium]|nr:choice-of-anchor D domain-containing protein [Candidatus Omnitrophota bacterium]